MPMVVGENIKASVQGVHEVPPEGWEAGLREVSPITTTHSHLRWYWYKASQRWVLYDCLPAHLIEPDRLYGGPITGAELLIYLEGAPPRELESWMVCPWVSDAQHEFYRVHKVLARPFWIMQGEQGGHQYVFTNDQMRILKAKMLPYEAPVVGSLPPCPWDSRVVQQLQRLNRLRVLGNSVDKLRESGDAASAAAQLAATEREIREAEMAFMEEQMRPTVELTTSLSRGQNPQTYLADDLLINLRDQGARAADALEEYRETGNFAL